MNNHSLLGPWIRRFLLEYLVVDRNLALNTQMSYRDTLVLFLQFVSASIEKPIDRLSIDDLRPTVVRSFLQHLERERRCSTATRNQRLCALHTLARFIALYSPEHVAWCAEIRTIPWKKTSMPSVSYLDKPEMDALLRAPDQRTVQGYRDHVLLLFLYNTGARVTEAAKLIVSGLSLETSPSVRIVGKGNKTRHCPLWSSTAKALSRLIVKRTSHESVFLNRRREPLTRFGIHTLVKRYVAAAARKVPSLQRKSVSAHTIRHYVASRAM